MKINGKDIAYSDAFKIAQAGRKWLKNKRMIKLSKDKKENVVYQWLKDSDIKLGNIRNRSRALFGHYTEYCNKNNIDSGLRLPIDKVGAILGDEFTFKNVGGVRFYEINKDFSGYAKKETKSNKKT